MQNLGLFTAQAVLRAGAVATAALLAARPLRECLAAPAAGQRSRRSAWALLLTPFLTPSLLVGYVYLPTALALVRQPAWKEFLYDGFLLVRFIPVAVLTLSLAPPPLSASARHCYGAFPARGWRERLGFRLRGAGRGPWAAGALVFLLVYGEFDLATMWNLKTWTSALFDAQAGGLALTESLKLAGWPLLGAAAAAGAVGVAVTHRQWLSVSPAHQPNAPVHRPIQTWATWIYLVLAAGITAGWPLARLLPEAVAGAGALAGNAGLWHDITFTALLAGCAAVATVVVAGEGIRRPWSGVLLAGAGLFGALLLALGLLWFFQLPGPRAIYNTPLPALTGLTLSLLPAALLLRLLRRWTRPGPALHLAKLLGHRVLRWELDGRKAYWAAFLLFCWAYFDLTITALLAPPGMTTVAVRVFNLMHYGRTPALSAMLCAAVAVPAMGAFAVSAVAKKGCGMRDAGWRASGTAQVNRENGG